MSVATILVHNLNTIEFFLAVASWGLNRGSKRAFRPAMALSSGELSSLSGSLLMMTATATPSTIRILQNQLPEINTWRTILSPPLRENVTLVVPPPEILSTDINGLLDPFINDMKKTQNPI